METPRTDAVLDAEIDAPYARDIQFNMLKAHAKELERQIISAQNCLVCAAIADPIEVIENALNILSDNKPVLGTAKHEES